MQELVTSIVAAVVAGVSAGTSAGLGEAVQEEIKTSYHALRERIVRLFGKKASVELAIEALERDPNSAQGSGALTELLDERDEDELANLNELAQMLLAAASADKAFIKSVVEAAENARITRSGVITTEPVAGSVDSKVVAGKGAKIKDSGVIQGQVRR